MKFTKMHGIGNDYIYVNCMDGIDFDPVQTSVVLSDRHFGVGSDGMILICPSDKADFRMRMFNADGSEGKMCGNGIRCFAKYVYCKGLTDRKVILIETLAGEKHGTSRLSRWAIRTASPIWTTWTRLPSNRSDPCLNITRFFPSASIRNLCSRLMTRR